MQHSLEIMTRGEPSNGALQTDLHVDQKKQLFASIKSCVIRSLVVPRTACRVVAKSIYRATIVRDTSVTRRHDG